MAAKANLIWRHKGRQKKVQLTRRERTQLLYWSLLLLLLMLAMVYVETLRDYRMLYVSSKAKSP